jgi:iron complex outermembrane receptor protein
VNPSAYLRFKATDDMTFYLQSARGFRSPQTNGALAYTGLCEQEARAVGLGPLTKPDMLWNYEAGMKSRFAGGRLGVNTAIYRQEWKGVQLPVQFACGSGGVINGGDVRGHGIEIEANARLTSAWQVNLSASYGHNEFEKVRPNTGFAVGDRVPGAAETNGSVGLQYNFALNATWNGFGRADYMYVGSTPYQFGQIAPVVVTLDSYGLTNLRFGVQRDNLSLELFGRNVTDERAVVNTIDPNQGNRQYLARPREIGVEVRYSFARSAR